MRIGRWIAVTTLALAGAMPVLAHDGAGREQFQAAVSSAFAQADVDGNGALSPEEFANFQTILRTEMAKARFARADTNGDGQVTLEELQAARPHHRCGKGGGADAGTDQNQN
jgi:hypothetical protein